MHVKLHSLRNVVPNLPQKSFVKLNNVFNCVDEMTAKEDKTNNCDTNKGQNYAITKLSTIENRTSVKSENDAKKTLTSPYAVSNSMAIDEREGEEGNETQGINQSQTNKRINGKGNISLPPNGYILPGKMKLGNALNIPALNSVYLTSIAAQNNTRLEFI